ncbi:MAG: M15 family metallopeptidase [Niabella sp.]|nr:M15 family metallopeptidase [Niabella sp.]
MRISEKTLLLLWLSLPLFLRAQEAPFGVQNTIAQYKQAIKADEQNRMVELKSVVPGLVYDLRYATANNFMHRTMYPAGTHQTFLRMPAARALQRVQAALAQQGLGLKIFDAYRPFSVTQRFWELVKDERYVANPAKGSNHNRGTAVDLTVIDLKTGKELPMGTGFDNFTDSAHQDFTQLAPRVLQNRLLLKTLMEQQGFQPLRTEWWHYTFSDNNSYAILDLSFKRLKQLQR